MIFEEALTKLRLGEKITHHLWEKDEYLMGCYVGFPSYYDDNGNLIEDSFEDKKKRGMSIVKMKGDHQHIDMCSHPELYGLSIDQTMGKVTKLMMEGKIPEPCSRPEIHKYPQLNLLLIMSDGWEIYL